MPKYTVTVTETVTTYYEAVEVEASTPDDAIIKAEEMAMNGEIGEGNGKSNWSSHVEAHP